MYPALKQELETFERRTPKSAEAHKKNLKRLPLGVASNYRATNRIRSLYRKPPGVSFAILTATSISITTYVLAR